MSPLLSVEIVQGPSVGPALIGDELMILTKFPFDDSIGLKVTRVGNGFALERFWDLETLVVDDVVAVTEIEVVKGKPLATNFDKLDNVDLELLGLCVNNGSGLTDEATNGLWIDSLFDKGKAETEALDDPSFGL